MKIKPLGSNMVVKELKEEKTTSFGMVLADGKNGEKRWSVVDVGSCTACEPSQTVVLKTGAGERVIIEGEEYRVVRADDVLAIIE